MVLTASILLGIFSVVLLALLKIGLDAVNANYRAGRRVKELATFSKALFWFSVVVIAVCIGIIWG